MPASHGAWKILWSLNPSEALTVFERILLITDGTVTDLLEAFAGEAISVVKLSQSIGHRNGDAHWSTSTCFREPSCYGELTAERVSSMATPLSSLNGFHRPSSRA